ncbi:AzlD domain-containing protein [Desulfovibrio inopinatus]|uniref:AzlD domain-containing protein n=1 Tax=Desulfovibrio inopinatus TaxID=102109 RepID=UPI000417D3B8|nr:AzlD domain-containing protein [Desulfovibrio inopinatus]
MTNDQATTFFLACLLLGLGTWIFRASFLLAADRLRTSERFIRLLSFIPAAVLSALVVPAIIYHQGHIDALHGKERIIAGIAAAIVAWRTKNILATITTGMVAVGVLEWIF